MIEVRWNHGIILPGHDLCLDPRFPSQRAFVSHAHSDHTGKHMETLCTPSTAKLMRARLGTLPGRVVELPYHETISWLDARMMLLPAGHILGSAQLFLESSSGSLLYTGDFKMRGGLSCEPAQFRRADTLVMETTFGRPAYVFPPTAETLARIVQFCHETIEDGERPVLLGYSLGKAQEIMAALASAELPIVLHPAVWKMTQLYRSLGVELPPAEKLDAKVPGNGVVIGPPHLRGSKSLARIPSRRVAFLSGWALEPGAVHRYACDAAFPLSDHADYPDLLRAVEEVAPRRVLTVHGFAAEFAADLRSRGIEAWALTGPDQLELPIESAPVSMAVREVPGTRDAAPDGTEIPPSGFGKFCRMCEQVASHSGRLAKVRTVADFFRHLREGDLSRCTVWLAGSPFPRGQGDPLGVGSSTLRKALADASGETPGAVRLATRRCGEIGRAALELLAGRAAKRRPDIGDIQAFFERLRGTRSTLERLRLLTDWLANLSPIEACYLVKLCSGDLRIGLRDGLVEEALALSCNVDVEAVRKANLLTGDPGATAGLARNHRLSRASMVLFRPLSCMLAGVEHDDGNLWKRFASLPDFPGTLWAEEKMDGIRAQLHHAQGRTEIFSRDGKRITSAFPEIADAARDFQMDCVLDGEILAWQGDRPLAFAELQKRLGRREPDLFFQGDIPVRFVAFDCLHLDGALLIDRPLLERRDALEQLPLSGKLGLATVRKLRCERELEETFHLVRSLGHEGLVIKDPASPYSPGRRGLAWIKRKRALGTLDVVVVAVEYGHGKRAGLLSDYTFAVRDEQGNHLVIGKAYTGLTDEEIARMTGVFLGLARRKAGRKIEVRPEIVIEVAFDAIRESDRHPSGLAMRFPRIKRLRPDKAPGDIDTISTARSLLSPD